MPTIRMPARGATCLLFLLGALLLMVGAGGPAAAKEWESTSHNVVVVIPDPPGAWEWLPANPAWAKAGIIKGAKRELAKLKDGSPGTGHGGLLHLAVRALEEGMTLKTAAQDDEIQKFFLARFGGNEGDLKTEELTVLSGSSKKGHPALLLRTEGKANNLKGNAAACQGVMLITVARGKLYLLRMYAFPTELDQEGIVVDVDYMETNCLELINTKEGATKGGPKQPANGGGEEGDGEAGQEEEEGEEELIEHRAQRWKLMKHKKLKMAEITEEEKNEYYLVFKCSDADSAGGYNLYVYAPPNTRYVDGVAVPAPNILKWITADWYQNFVVNHPEGELATFKWPKKPSTKGAKTFLTIPDLDDPKARKVVFKAGRKRPVEVDSSDMIKKYKFVQKVKKNHIGKRGKASEAVRGIMQGKRPRVPGQETVIRWAFRNRDHSYRVFVTFWGMAYKKWGDPIRKTLESWEFGIKYKD